MHDYELKIDLIYFLEIKSLKKRFEIRKNDRKFRINDIIKLREFDRECQEYTGDFIMVKINYIEDDFLYSEGYVVFSFDLL